MCQYKYKKKMTKAFKRGSAAQHGPRLVGDILREVLLSDSPLARGWRGWRMAAYPHTEPGIDLKLLTRHRGRLPIGGYLGGTIVHDGENHYSFVEIARAGRWVPQQRNPHIYEGRFVNVNRRPDGRLYPSLTPPPYTEVFTFRHFCLAAAEELRMVADMIG